MRGNIQWSEGTTDEAVAPAGGRPPSGTADDFPSHDPQLIARDEAIFLLHTAAEIEHSLMVQYLYAAMTLNLGTEEVPDAQTPQWQRIILGIAKEEMGHFITVQNILRLIGGPLNFEREDTPFRSDYYPFRFSLRRLTIGSPVRGDWDKAGSLNRYIAAEMPPLNQIEKGDLGAVAEVMGTDEKSLLDAHDSLSEINTVGRLYARLIDIFENKLAEEDFLAADDIKGYMADAATWDRAGEHFDVMVLPTRDRQEAVEALRAVAEQGEGAQQGKGAKQRNGAKQGNGEGGAGTSHFQRFLTIYRQFKERQAKGESDPALPVPDDPTPAKESKKKALRDVEDKEFEQKGLHRITDPAARLWAQLFDLRYRMTLGLIMHQMLLDSKYGPDSVMARRALANAAITEMHSLGWIARAIVTRPLTSNVGEKMKAAPAFELPYTFAFPDREAERARVHLVVLGAVELLVKKLQEEDKSMSPDEKELLHWLTLRDLTLKRLCNEIAAKKKKWCKCDEEEEASGEEEEAA